MRDDDCDWSDMTGDRVLDESGYESPRRPASTPPGPVSTDWLTKVEAGAERRRQQRDRLRGR
jgi:hypothetical protein